LNQLIVFGTATPEETFSQRMGRCEVCNAACRSYNNRPKSTWSSIQNFSIPSADVTTELAGVLADNLTKALP